MRKWISVTVTLLVVLGMVLSCAPAPTPEPTKPPEVKPTPTTPPPAKVKIVFWEQEGDDVDVFIDELVADFMAKNPDIEVERTHYGNEELRDQFQTAALAGAGPELARCPNDFAGPFSALGIVADIQAIFDQAFLDTFFDGALGPAVVAGTLWGVPDNYGNHLMLLYNKDIVTEPPKTTDELISMAKALTNEAAGVYGFAYNLNEPFWLAPWIGGFGGWPLDDTDSCSLGTDAVAKALQFVHDLKFVEKVVPQECDYNTMDTLFKEGKAAMIINGDWSLGGYTEAGVNYGTAPIPQVSATGLWPSPMTSGKYWMFNKAILGDAAKLAAAKKFVEYMTSEAVQTQWLERFKRLPSNKVVAENPLIAQDPILAGSMAQLSKGKGMPAAPQMRCAWDSMRPNQEAVMAGTATAAEAAASMQRECDACVREAGLAPPLKIKIAVVSDIGGRGDLSFNDMAFKGGDDAVRDFGVEMVELISKVEADYVPNLTTAAKDPDVKLIVGVGFLLSDALAEVARKYPDKNFVGIDTYSQFLVPADEYPLPNLMDVVYEEHKGSALVGALGALLAAHYDKPHIGGVFGIEIPVLWKFEIGYKWGARWATEWLKANKPEEAFDYTKDFVLWTYTGTFSDITKGYAAAKPMYAADAVAVYNIAGPLGLGINEAVMELAEEKALKSGPPFWIGVDANQDWINPGFIIASMMKRVDYGVYYATKLVLDGKFERVVRETNGSMTLGIGTTVAGELMEGISVSTLADLDEFIAMGVRAEELTGKKVLPASPEEIRAAVKAMRDAQPEWIWRAVAELEEKIRTGEVEVPLVFTEEDIKKWRDELG